MHKKIVYVALFVSDQDQALDYYTSKVGLEQRLDVRNPDGTRFLTVGVAGQDFELVLWPGTPGKATPVNGIAAAAYTIETADCRQAYETLRSRGVTFEATGIIERPWGYVARFTDPDGNLLQLRQGR